MLTGLDRAIPFAPRGWTVSTDAGAWMNIEVSNPAFGKSTVVGGPDGDVTDTCHFATSVDPFHEAHTLVPPLTDWVTTSGGALG